MLKHHIPTLLCPKCCICPIDSGVCDCTARMSVPVPGTILHVGLNDSNTDLCSDHFYSLICYSSLLPQSIHARLRNLCLNEAALCAWTAIWHVFLSLLEAMLLCQGFLRHSCTWGQFGFGTPHTIRSAMAECLWASPITLKVMGLQLSQSHTERSPPVHPAAKRVPKPSA